LRTNGLFAWLAAAIGAIIPLQAAIYSGRRENTVQFFLTLALTLYYQKKIRPPRLAIVFAVLFAMLAIPATGTYRAIAAERNWSQVRQIDLVGNFENYLNSESILELRNAAMVMEATQHSGSYDYGAGYWDQLVFRFVPAQLLGKGFKDSLMFQSSDERTQNDLSNLGYAISGGSTITGMADSFQQFGWFGCVFFAALGLLFKTLFRATQQPNAVFAQLFYILIATSALRAVTHQTIDFLPGLVYYIIFLGLLFLYARAPVALVGRRGRNRTPDIQPEGAALPAKTEDLKS
jgi:cytochrome b561